MAEVCNVCGLPHQLCVCEDVAKERTTVSLETEERRYNKTVTIVSGFASDANIEDLASELKSNLGCGGTTKNGVIELQGDHMGRIESELEERGFDLS